MTERSILDEALAAHRAGQLDTAIAGYRRALDQGAGPGAANLLAIALDATGAAEEAERVLAAAVARDSSAPQALLNLGRLRARRGAIAQAVEPFREASAGGLAEATPLWFAAATVVHDLAGVVEAGLAMARAGTLQPAHWRPLIAACFRQGDHATAYRQCRAVVDAAPGAPDLHAVLARALAERGDPDRAVACFRRALCLAPEAAARWNDYGALIKPGADSAASLTAFDRALAIDPRLVPALRNKAVLLVDIAEPERAQKVYDRALAIAPDDPGLAFKRALTFPTITRSEAEIDAIRADVEARIRALAASGQRLADPLTEVGLPNFYLAYHGRNERHLQSLIADTYLELCPELAYVAPHCRAPRPVEDRRLRVGFASRFFYDHSIRDLSEGMIRHLDRSRFELHIVTDRPISQITLFRPGEKPDSYTILPIDLAQARAAIAALELDVLIYGDIGMEPLTFYLAFARLAPVQAHLQGHPVTPGIPNLDYFFTSALEEPADYRDHYRETPVPFSQTYFCYEPMPEVPPARRSDFGLPERGALYYCTQTLFKFHPDFDDILRGILEGDPAGWLLLIEDKFPARTRQVDERLADTLGACHDRVIWIPRLSKQRFFQLMTLSAVTLDTTHFTGGNTTLQSLGLGVPTVTLPAPYVRGRLTLGWLAQAGLMEMCAADPGDYVRIALRFGLDPAWRAEVVQRIEAAQPLLFGRFDVVEEIQDFLVQAVAAAAAGQPPIQWNAAPAEPR